MYSVQDSYFFRYDEIKKFYGDSVTPLEYFGNPHARAEQRSKFNNVNIVVTSYEVVRNDVEILEKVKKLGFGNVV